MRETADGPHAAPLLGIRGTPSQLFLLLQPHNHVLAVQRLPCTQHAGAPQESLSVQAAFVFDLAVKVFGCSLLPSFQHPPSARCSGWSSLQTSSSPCASARRSVPASPCIFCVALLAGPVLLCTWLHSDRSGGAAACEGVPFLHRNESAPVPARAAPVHILH